MVGRRLLDRHRWIVDGPSRLVQWFDSADPYHLPPPNPLCCLCCHGRTTLVQTNSSIRTSVYSHRLHPPRWATSQTTHGLYRREVAGQQPPFWAETGTKRGASQTATCIAHQSIGFESRKFLICGVKMLSLEAKIDLIFYTTRIRDYV